MVITLGGNRYIHGV